MNNPLSHKLTEAVEGQQAGAEVQAESHGPAAPQGRGATPEQVAEDTRRAEEARSHGRPDREDYLVTVGRGQQTHG